MFCSTVIPTIGRPSLDRAVQSVLDQELTEDDFEVIVVNDSGKPLPAAEWQDSDRVRILLTDKRERSVAKNTGAAIAHGDFLHFLDDDDCLLPGALETFRQVALGNGSVLLYGSHEVANRAGLHIDTYRPDIRGDVLALLVSGEMLPPQATIIRRSAFFAAGMFDTRRTAGEDLDLARRVCMLGSADRTEAVVARIAVGSEGSSSDFTRFRAAELQSLDALLRNPTTRQRIRASAATPYWRGRVCRTMLSSAYWVFEQRAVGCAADRVLQTLAMAGPFVLRREFWRGLRRIRG